MDGETDCPLLRLISPFFRQAFEELERLLGEQNVCVAVKEKLTKDSGVAGAGAYDHIVEKLQKKPKARGKKYLHTLKGEATFK